MHATTEHYTFDDIGNTSMASCKDLHECFDKYGLNLLDNILLFKHTFVMFINQIMQLYIIIRNSIQWYI